MPPTFADLTALMDRLAILESIIRQSAATFAEHADQGAHVREMAEERQRHAADLGEAISMLERYAQIIKMMEHWPGGAGVSPRQLKAIIGGRRLIA